MIGFVLFLFFAGILVGGMVILYSLFSREEKQKWEFHKKWMLENAVVLEAEYLCVHTSSNNDDTVYQLVCEANDLKGGKENIIAKDLP